MRESVVENYLKERVKLAGGFTRKLSYIGSVGCPDRLVCFPGRHLLVELKRPGKDATEEQKREHVRLRSAGFDVRVISTLDGVDLLIAEVSFG